MNKKDIYIKQRMTAFDKYAARYSFVLPMVAMLYLIIASIFIPEREFSLHNPLLYIGVIVFVVGLLQTIISRAIFTYHKDEYLIEWIEKEKEGWNQEDFDIEVIKMKFIDAPVGARFKYPGEDTIWVKINSYGTGTFYSGDGLICQWNGNVKGHQSFCTFVDKENGIDNNTEVELV